MTEYLILLIDAILFIAILHVYFTAEHQLKNIKRVGLVYAFVVLALTLLMLISFNVEKNTFSFRLDVLWTVQQNVFLSLGVDGVSIFFIILTALLIPICMLISWESIKYKAKMFTILLLFTEFLLVNVFTTLDLLFFYIFFEAILLPMFILINIWGSRQRKIHAAYQFFLYTLVGSILLLIAILIMYSETGTTDIQLLSQFNFSENRQLYLWFAFFLSFAVKVPMVPVHIWLPEAHVEAPTAGSVLLAGVLLKLGTYGMIRFMLPLFPFANKFFAPLIITLCILAVIYSSLTTIRQIDLKKIIAYSSVAHMNFGLIGIFTNTTMGLDGNMYLMLGHGLVSSGLFLCVGVLYDRYHTRNILYFGGLAQAMPIFSVFFLIFTLANIGFPGTVNFIGEFLILTSILEVNSFAAFLAGTSLVLGAVYSIWLYNRVIYGQLSKHLLVFSDLNRREFHLFLPLVILTLWIGIYSTPILEVINGSINYYIVL